MREKHEYCITVPRTFVGKYVRQKNLREVVLLLFLESGPYKI